MKIESDSLFTYEGYIDFKVQIENEDEIEIFQKIIRPDDIITIKSKNICALFVLNCQYIEEPNKEFIINGVDYFSMNIKMSISIKEKLELIVHANSDSKSCDKLAVMCFKKEEFEKYNQAISDDEVQEKGFQILKHYMNYKPEKVRYGKSVLEQMKQIKIKVVFVGWTFIKGQDKTWIDYLTNKDHKYKNTNIVVVSKGTEYYKELKEKGEIIGVLF